MRRTTNLILVSQIFILCSLNLIFGQDGNTPLLFETDSILHIKWQYSIKDLKKETDDSTYMNVAMSYLNNQKSWNEVNTRIRKRGNFRLKNCYFTPVKLKIKKSEAAGSIFEGQKTFKIVLPCKLEKDKNDNVIKEYLAYKIYEIVSPYHFKTRLMNVDFEEIKGKKTKLHQIKGFLIEDDKHIAKRLGGNVYKRKVHPMQQEEVSCTRDALFQYMIGNTDFSEAYRHNVKLFFIDQNYIPIPYDFDMSGLVNASYSVVSQIQGEQLPIGSVRQRLFRGFQRDTEVFMRLRQDFLSKQAEIIQLVKDLKPYFEVENEYIETESYIREFFALIADDDKYYKEIIKKARTE